MSGIGVVLFFSRRRCVLWLVTKDDYGHLRQGRLELDATGFSPPSSYSSALAFVPSARWQV